VVVEALVEPVAVPPEPFAVVPEGVVPLEDAVGAEFTTPWSAGLACRVICLRALRNASSESFPSSPDDGAEGACGRTELIDGPELC
jgi:hypothetical protein